MHTSQTGVPALRLAELIASLSLAIDLGMGQPMENFLRACLLAVRLGEALHLGDQELVAVYYLALLRYVGCTADTREAVTIFEDDVAANTWLMAVDQGHPAEMLRAVIQNLGKDQTVLHRMRLVAKALALLPLKVKGVTAAHCEVGQRLAERLGVGLDIQAALGQVHERWDGRGLPYGLKGESIGLPVRVVQLAHDAEYFHRLDGVEAAIAMIRHRASGGAYDPSVAERFCCEASRFLAEPRSTSVWEEVLAAEPGDRPYIPEAQLDTALQAIADFVDLKSPYTVGHSRGVAELAAATARRCGLPEVDVVTIRRAGWLHDLGRIAISSGIWNKPGPLTDGEWERVRLHPYYTERVLARPKALTHLGTLAALHHERLDGSGYHRGIPASLLPITARILAAADIYHALTEPRPHRAAHSPEEAAAEVRRQVGVGRLDGEVVNALLVVAGHRVRSVRRQWIAGLSDREIEVLRLIARGQSNRQIASHLSISERTVEHHVEHIYNKTGVSTRAAATLFAMQHHLLSTIG